MSATPTCPVILADLTLVTLSERLNVAEILSLDSDFDVYRRYRASKAGGLRCS